MTRLVIDTRVSGLVGRLDMQTRTQMQMQCMDDRYASHLQNWICGFVRRAGWICKWNLIGRAGAGVVCMHEGNDG